MPAHVPMFIVRVLCVRTTMENELVRGFPPSPFPLCHSHLKEANHLPCSLFVCHYTGAHVRTHVSVVCRLCFMKAVLPLGGNGNS